MKNLFALTTIAAGLVLASAASQAAVVLYLDPIQTNAAQGATFDVAVKISGLGSEIVSALDINILFNPALLSATGVSVNTGEFGFSDFGLATFGAGNVGINGLSLELDDDLAAIQTDDAFTLVTLSFLAGAVDGSSTLLFGAPLVFSSNIVGRGSNSVNVALQGACVTVGAGGPCATNVPEPTSYALVGLGLFAAFAPTALRRRKTAAVTA